MVPVGIAGKLEQENARLRAALLSTCNLLDALPGCGYVHETGGQPICYSPDGALAEGRRLLREIA